MLYHIHFIGGVAYRVPFGEAPAKHLPRTVHPYAKNRTTAIVAPRQTRPRIIRLITLFKQPGDRGAGDIVTRWMKQRFTNGKTGTKNTLFMARLATGCACQSRVEVLNALYSYRSAGAAPLH